MNDVTINTARAWLRRYSTTSDATEDDDRRRGLSSIGAFN
ncbi:hypothetical protein GN958_ATG19151 [Phytophthora infestans]|uniref:Uncharacterized protein n=1 Tax=Phytophthora infestans TaxID=4787 RepID=A0A8S9TX80_PHYIN|nr:hypothetical protein GN958_ATG19151 [Phytophthora infestans]